jgi:predicted  nucleic acid-binding Zn-ribbon protein
MNRIFFLLFFLMNVVAGASAQVKEDTRVMVSGAQPCLTVIITGAEPAFVDQEWKAYMTSYGKVTKVKGSKESVVTGIHIVDVGMGDMINAYSLTEEAVGGTKMIVWLEVGGKFLTSKDSTYKKAVNFMDNFVHKVQVDLVAIDLEAQQKKLTQFESNLAKLERQNESLNKIIIDAKLKIEGAEAEIPINLSTQDATKADIDAQKATVDAARDNPDEMKVQQKQLTKLESNLTKLQRENESLHKVVTDANAKIKKAEMDITTNLEAQEAAKTEIANQKIVIDSVQQKLDKMKAQKPK